MADPVLASVCGRNATSGAQVPDRRGPPVTSAGSPDGADAAGGPAPADDGGARGSPAPRDAEGRRSARRPGDRERGCRVGGAEGEADGDASDPSADLVRFWYRRHADRVYRFARWRAGSRHRAEEVVADVFVEAWRSSESYDPERGSVESWLLGIARNVLRRDEREQAREAERRAAAELDDLASPRPGPEEDTLRRRRVERLMEAVWELPGEDRDLVALAYGADLSRRRIARMLEISPEAVRVRLHRVLARLRGRLEESEE